MAKSAHTVAGNIGVCPMAMVMTAMIEKYTKKEAVAQYSDLTPRGSVTNITVSTTDYVKK
ncbi:unnamed protein product [marine sediment metagenome]|uniref:Uncharacterized protein n=1 Tax=marine sediment metagenome TaxID=412755 RepID=X1ATC0_9ZZZZ